MPEQFDFDPKTLKGLQLPKIDDGKSPKPMPSLDFPQTEFSKPFRSPEEDKELVYVPMGMAEAVTATGPKPKVGTTSLASCAGIGIYDPETRVGGIAHVFFNEKTSYVHYDTDASGRQIPSSGREIVHDDPYWYRRFEHLMSALLKKAQEKGGKAFEFHGFNVLQGARTKEQNEQLARHAQEVVKRLQDEGVLVGEPDWKMWQGVTLDTRTGQFTPEI